MPYPPTASSSLADSQQALSTSSSRKWRPAKAALLAGRWLLSGLLFVFVLEICARTEDAIRYGAPFWGNYSLDSIYQYDEMGKYGRPHASYLKWHLNNEGYRGPELRDHTYRIACIGSSETFGLYE